MEFNGPGGSVFLADRLFGVEAGSEDILVDAFPFALQRIGEAVCTSQSAEGFDTGIDLVSHHIFVHFCNILFAGFGRLATYAPEGRRHESGRVTAQKFVDINVNEDASVVRCDDGVERKHSASPNGGGDGMGTQDVIKTSIATVVCGYFAGGAVMV